MTGKTEPMALTIGGMSCQHCVRAVREALDGLPGVEVSRVEIGTAELRFDPAAVTPDAISAAIVDAGYEVAPASDA